MTQWGAERYGANSQPNWYKDLSSADSGYPANNVIYSRPNHPAADENLELTVRGWERVVTYTDSAGNTRIKREVVVAQGNAAHTVAYGGNASAVDATSGSPEIVDIRWSTANTADAGGDGYLFSLGGAVNVTVVFSEAVYLDETSARATVNVGAETTPGDGQDFFLTAYCLAGNGTNKLVFSNTVTKAAGEALSLPDSATFINLNGGAVLTGVANQIGTDTLNYVAADWQVANVSSYGVKVGDGGDNVLERPGTTLGADAGVRLVKTE